MRKVIILSFLIFILHGFLLSQTILVTSPNGGTFGHGQQVRITWITTGISMGNFKIVLIKEDRSFRKTIVPSMAFNAAARLDYTIPGDIPGGSSYFIKIRLVGSQISARSRSFSIMTTAEAVGIRISLPSRNQKFALGSPVLIEWNMPSVGVCGSKVNIFAKRISTGEERIIVDNRNCGLGRNTFDWLISTPSYYNKTGDYCIKMVSDTGCTQESETFQILTQDDYDAATTTGSDFSFDSVTFSNGQQLNHGIAIAPDTDLTGTFSVDIKWNKSLPSSNTGNHSVGVSSVLTGETINTSNNPNHFSHEDAHSSTGIIRINVPFAIPADRILSMKRGRFIPLLFKLNINPPICDKVARNNIKQFRMRVIENAPSADFAVEIVPNTLKIKRDKLQKTSVFFEIQVKVRNLATNDAGGPPSPINNVVCNWTLTHTGRGGWPGEETLPTVTSNWVFHTITLPSLHVEKNLWRPLTFSFTVDRVKHFLDPNRRNNTVVQEFTVPD